MNSPNNFQQLELSDIRINLDDTIKKSAKRSNMMKDNNSKMITSGIP